MERLRNHLNIRDIFQPIIRISIENQFFAKLFMHNDVGIAEFNHFFALIEDRLNDGKIDFK